VLARLLLVLLLAAFSLPAAVASCHDAPAPMTGTHAMHGSGHQPMTVPDGSVASHACVGCVPPSGMLAKRIEPPLPAPSMAPAAFVATLDLGGAVPPDLPPPRRG